MIKNKRTLMFTGSVLNFIGILKRLAYIAGLLCFAVLCLTGFGSLLISGSLCGYWLMLHAACAPVFALCAVFLGITYAGDNEFSMRDWIDFTGIFKRKPVQCACIMQKCCFWAMLILLLPVILSILLCMFPVFGTHAQELMVFIHLISTSVFLLVFMVHISLVLRSFLTGKIR